MPDGEPDEALEVVELGQVDVAGLSPPSRTILSIPEGSGNVRGARLASASEFVVDGVVHGL